MTHILENERKISVSLFKKYENTKQRDEIEFLLQKICRNSPNSILRKTLLILTLLRILINATLHTCFIYCYE